ncbi:hypothetical protein BBJ28_00010276 [Nothophytophthora sp. Chile5]|nr:hypothetical protein BBJ28_00010276 [Nothophytophthora sp. Chile5]
MAPLPHRGRWQREYERDWRNYTLQALTDRFGERCVQSPPRVTRQDEQELRQVLAAAGIAHVPPSHRRWQAPFPASRTLEDEDDDMSGESYVYSTPDAFTSQELAAPPGSGRRVSASQRLQLRLADVSPIADARRVSIGGAGTISPPSGAAKSPWTPKSAGKKRHTPRSIGRGQTAVDLDVSMQSMHLSDDEKTRDDEDDGLALPVDGEDVEPMQTEADANQTVAASGNETNRRCEETDRQSTGGEAEASNVSKVLTFSSDSESEDQDDAADVDVDAAIEVKVCPPAREQSSPTDEQTEPPPWNSEPDIEYGHPSDVYGDIRHDNREQQHTQSQPGDSDAGKASQGSKSLSAIEGQAQRRDRVASGGHQSAVASHAAAIAVRTTRKSTTQAPVPPGRFSTSTSSTTSSSSKSSMSRKRANRGPLLHTKLPLQMEYRFASDRRRRRRRRKSLAAKPGVFPYVMPELLVELQPYQKEALQWMLEREQEPGGPISIEQQRRGEATAVDSLVAKVRGGVLADEMGLGKTVCCLALICESLRQTRAAEAQAQTTGEGASAVPRLTPPTLIVMPLSILSQWEREIRTKTNLSVVTYQGATRKGFRSAAQFMGADVVLSTYDTLRLMECKVQCKNSDDDDHDEAGGTAGTLESVSGWHQAPRLTPRSRRPVVTSKLHQLHWHRVILDESHLIANAGCARARAAFTLNSGRRWCVTGTPIQNRTADLAALLQFLGLGTRAHALSERELGALVPRVVLRRLKSTVDARSRAPILELPEKTEEVLELEFASDVERALYMLLHRSTKRQVLRYLQSKEPSQAHRAALTTPTTPGRHGSNERPLFMHVFELLLRLRQVCDACTLVTADPLSEVQTRVDSAESIVGQGSDDISPFSADETALLQRLQHQQSSDASLTNGCGPLESTKLTALMCELDKVRARGERVLVISQWTCFLDMIAERLDARNEQIEGRASTLEEASAGGRQAIAFAKLDGRMAARDRELVVRAFQMQEDGDGVEGGIVPPLDVLLLSLRTGGLGLNLTAASHVFLMEPSWNPSLERQAVDRAHRFGQRRQVRVVRFLLKDTIEERVVALQNKKRQLTAAFLGDGEHGSEARGTRRNPRETRLSRGDLRGLFFTQQEQEMEMRDEDEGSEQQSMDGDESDGSVTCYEMSE